MDETLSPTELDAFFKTCLTDKAVSVAFMNCSWLTMEYLLDLGAKRQIPAQQNRPQDIDPEVRTFLRVFWDESNWGEVLKKAKQWIDQQLRDKQGHPYEIGEMSFFDDELRSVADVWGEDEHFQMDRQDAIFGSAPYLACLVAPESLRPKVISANCPWNDTYFISSTGPVIISAVLVRKGVEKFMEVQNPEV